MWAKIFVKKENNFHFTQLSTIEGPTESLKTGIQPADVKKKVFKWHKEYGKDPVGCQILILETTQAKVMKLSESQRSRAPRLNNSDYNDDPNKVMQVKRNLKTKSKDLQKHMKKNAAIAAAKILEAHKQKQKQINQELLEDKDEDEDEAPENQESSKKISEPSSPLSSNPEDDDEDGSSKDSDAESTPADVQQVVTPQTSDEEEDKEDEDEEKKEEEGEFSNNDQAAIGNLKFKLKSALQQKKVAIDVAKRYKLQYENLKAQKELEEARKDIHENNKIQMEGFPEIIKTHSGVLAKRSAVETAYTKSEPSKFYEIMMYSTWGHKDLSTRCVKLTKRKNQSVPSQQRKLLTPKKREAVQKHFVNYLNHFKFSPVIYQFHFNKMNDYAHRAIRNSHKFMEKITDSEFTYEDLEPEDVEKIEL